MKKKIVFDSKARPAYEHLRPIVALLLSTGNELARDYEWGSDRTGYYCLLRKPIDFDLVEAEFEIPEFIQMGRLTGCIECNETWVSIRSL